LVGGCQQAARAITLIVSGASSLGMTTQSVNQTATKTAPQRFNVRVTN